MNIFKTILAKITRGMDIITHKPVETATSEAGEGIKPIPVKYDAAELRFMQYKSKWKKKRNIRNAMAWESRKMNRGL